MTLSEHPEAIASRKWNKAHPGRARLERMAWKTRALMLLGGKCTRCGVNDSRVLQIDHINGGGWKNPIASLTRKLVMTVWQESKEYQLLCANCNWIKRSEQNEVAGYLKQRNAP